MSMTIRWRWPSPYCNLFLVWFCACLWRYCKQPYFLCTNSHINISPVDGTQVHESESLLLGHWQYFKGSASPSLSQIDSSVNGEPRGIWRSNSFPGAIHGTEEGSDAFPTSVSMWWSTVWILQKASTLWINRLQSRSHVQPTTHQAHQNLCLKPTKTDTTMGKFNPGCYKLLMK